jgi:hypothetical protein
LPPGPGVPGPGKLDIGLPAPPTVIVYEPGDIGKAAPAFGFPETFVLKPPAPPPPPLPPAVPPPATTRYSILALPLLTVKVPGEVKT